MGIVSNAIAARCGILMLAALLGGCATGAAPDAMVPQPAGFEAPSSLRGGIALNPVSGGSETSPLWVSRVSNADLESALLMALRNEGLLAPDPARAPMQLSVNIVSVRTPSLAFAPEVTSQVHYVVTSGGRVVSDETVTATDSAALGDAVLGVDRVRIASERSIRANIAEYFARLKRVAAAGARPTPLS
jgi:hypothetical protein